VLGKYAREEGLFPLETAVRKMTGLAADTFGLEGRGYVRAGCWADLVLFDADKVIDRATYAEPVQRSEGIVSVWVNGVLTYTAEGLTGERGGRFLRRQVSK
jgi:N-acyl-D-aspartate/D-glutamate deacylase